MGDDDDGDGLVVFPPKADDDCYTVIWPQNPIPRDDKSLDL